MGKTSNYCVVITAIIILLMSATCFSQSINTDFGKNRVQYHDDFDNWWRYETENFITLWYGKGKNVAKTVTQLAEIDHDEIQNIMEHRTNDKIEILVYTDVSDLKQSNIGLDDTFTSQPGETKIVGNKMFVHFNGDHQHLRVQIREGIASVYLSAMLFGDNFQEMVQNAVLLDLPDWYKRGIISYCGRKWDHEVDDELRDILFQNEKYYDFKKLSDDYPRIAGHSMWLYLDQNYGRSSISNILYLTRITRSLKNALLYVLNNDIEVISKDWSSYFYQHYAQEEGKFKDDTDAVMDLSNKGHVPVSRMRFSPDGKYLAYAYNEIGKYRIKLKNLETGKEKTIFKYGHKNNLQATDYNYPIFAWHPSSNELTFIFEHRDVIKLRRYNLEEDAYIHQRIPTDFQRIYNISYKNDDEYIFTANNNGFSDLFNYQFKTRQYQKITNDFYDDLDAEVVTLKGKKGILFSSNRQKDHLFPERYDTIIPIDKFDLFFYDLEADNGSVQRITKTPDINERYPFLVSDDKVLYLSSESGVTNRYVVSTLDPYNYYSISNKSRNIIRHHINKNSKKHIYTYYFDGKYEVMVDTIDVKTPIIPHNTRFNNRKKSGDSEVFIPVLPEALEEEMQDGFKFQSEFDDPEEIEEINTTKNLSSQKNNFFKDIVIDEPETKNNDIELFDEGDVIPSKLKFRLDNFTTKLDNEILFEGLESYTGNGDELIGTPMGILLKANVNDIFEDYKLEAGARYPLSFNGSEYFLTYENRKKLIDKKYAIYRRSQTDVIDESIFPIWKAKQVSTLGLVQWKYPFDIFRSLRATTILRFDRLYSQVVDNNTFNQPIENEKRFSLKLEYVYDNSIDVALNVKHGTRYKVFVEAINEFDLQVVDGAEFDLSKGFTGIIGFDARHYIPLFKHSVIALRAAGATSMGSNRNLYYLGGVNNMISNPFNQQVAVPSGDFAYKTNIFHLRGFDTNIRNGTSYALVNTEVRLPVFRYFMGSYGGSNFLRNFQLVLFYDLGTAWHGSSPYSDENPLNAVVVESPPVLSVTVRYYRDPLVMGYGGGIRMNILGYYLRFDLARGIETRRIQDPKFHFSIGTDF